MEAGHLLDRMLFFPGKGIDDRLFPVNAGKTQHLLDIPIVILSANEGEEAVALNVSIALQDFQGGHLLHRKELTQK